MAVEEPPIVPWGWLRCVLFLLAFLVMTVVMGIVIYVAFGLSSESQLAEIMGSPTGVVIQFVTLVATVLLVWVFRFALDRRSFVSLGLSLGSIERRDLLAGMAWGIGLIGLVFLALLASGQIVLGPVAFPVEALLIQLALGMMVALSEEISTRGYMLNNLMQSSNKYLALLLVSVLFAAFHGLNPNLSLVGLINIVLAGLVLGIYYVHRGNLWFPIGLHFTWNLFQGAVFGAPVSGLKFASIFSFEATGDELLTGGDFGFEASLITTVLMVLAILAIHFKYRARAEIGGAGAGSIARINPGENEDILDSEG
jgi:CAAX protease family protein